MSMEARATKSLSGFEQLRLGREILATESEALAGLAKRLNNTFCRAVGLVYGCRGAVIVSGMGKAGQVGQKISSTLSSTGTPSHYLHPAEAVHGDLGRVTSDDVLLILSQSGETEEVVRLLPWLGQMRVPLVAITARADSTLGRAAAATIELGSLAEADPLGLAPSTSTTAMLALGDALALVVSRMRGFGREDFARFHPAGALGRKLSKVEDFMRPIGQCRMASDQQTVREVFLVASKPGRRSGAIMLVDEANRLTGIFTDSDLARLFERRRDQDLDRPIRDVMTARPCTVSVGARMSEAVALIAARKISELPVVDDAGVPAGMIDITDIVGLTPAPEDDASSSGSPTICRLFAEPDPSDLS